MNEHDMQRSVEFYKLKILKKRSILSALINIVLVYRMSHLGSISYVKIANKFVKQCLIKFIIVLNWFKKSLGNCFCRAGPGLGMQWGCNGPGPKLNSGPRAVTGLALRITGRVGPSESGPCRSLAKNRFRSL